MVGGARLSGLELMGVFDQFRRAYELEGLRVVDAFMVPAVVRANAAIQPE